MVGMRRAPRPAPMMMARIYLTFGSANCGRRHHHGDEAGFLEFIGAHAVGEQEADAAGADDAQDGGRARIVLEHIESVGDHQDQYLRHHPAADDLEAIAACGAHAVHLLVSRR